MPTDTITTAAARNLAEEAKALADAATAGPWEFDPENYGIAYSPGYGLIAGHGGSLGVTVQTTRITYKPYENADKDAAFIAFARDAVPALAAALSALADQLDTAREALTFYAKEWSGNDDGLRGQWMEPTPALLDDEGDAARAALASTTKASQE